MRPHVNESTRPAKKLALLTQSCQYEFQSFVIISFRIKAGIITPFLSVEGEEEKIDSRWSDKYTFLLTLYFCMLRRLCKLHSSGSDQSVQHGQYYTCYNLYLAANIIQTIQYSTRFTFSPHDRGSYPFWRIVKLFCSGYLFSYITFPRETRGKKLHPYPPIVDQTNDKTIPSSYNNPGRENI